MTDLVRLSMSLDRPLYERLEELVQAVGAGNRSEFIRDLLRTHLAIRQWSQDAEVLGVISLMYDHHAHGLAEKLLDLQHDSLARILAATHVHLEQHCCVEVLIASGRARAIHMLSEAIRQLKGIRQVSLSLLPSGSGLP